jgi:hypothetical protein
VASAAKASGASPLGSVVDADEGAFEFKNEATGEAYRAPDLDAHLKAALGAGLVLRAALAGLAGLLAVALAPLAGGAITAVDGRLVVACAAAALLLQGQPGFRALLRSDLRIATVFAVNQLSKTKLCNGGAKSKPESFLKTYSGTRSGDPFKRRCR